MNAIGSQEVHFPALIPREIFEASGRWADYGDTLFRLHDRKGVDYLLAPTHEELFTLLVKGEYSSYKDYPLSLYQIQTKYRDEARPRAGILRGREFIMKDSYSFDLTDEGLERVLPGAPRRLRADLHPARVRRTRSCSRCPARWAARRRRSSSRRPPSGEDTFVQCTNCDYAANTEAVEIAAPRAAGPGRRTRPQQVLDTPDTPTIDTLVDAAERAGPAADEPFTGADTLKNVVLRDARAGRGRMGAAGRRRARRPRGRPQADRRPARAGRGRAGRAGRPGAGARSW